jgi:riboflavin synthase
VFTGIIEEVAAVVEFDGKQLSVTTPASWATELPDIGESIAVNGCCLTLTDAAQNLRFGVSEETLKRTMLYLLKVGHQVNLERAAKVGDRLGGHIVQGHVDMVGYFLGARTTKNSHIVRFQVHEVFDRYLIDKGSIAVNGISLTVVEPKEGVFECAIIPHTWENTNLKLLEAGDHVNLEFDVIAKYVEKLMPRGL